MTDRFYLRGAFSGREASFGKPLPSFKSMTLAEDARRASLADANARFVEALQRYFANGGRA